MQHAGVEVFLGRQMPDTGHKRLPQRPIISPFGKDLVDGRVMNRWLALGVLRYGQTLPLHPGVEHPEDEVKDPVIAQFALWSALRHRKVRQDKCLKLGCRELDRNRCRCRRWCRGAPHVMASWEEEGCPLEKQITSDQQSFSQIQVYTFGANGQ